MVDPTLGTSCATESPAKPGKRSADSPRRLCGCVFFSEPWRKLSLDLKWGSPEKAKGATRSLAVWLVVLLPRVYLGEGVRNRKKISIDRLAVIRVFEE